MTHSGRLWICLSAGAMLVMPAPARADSDRVASLLRWHLGNPSLRIEYRYTQRMYSVTGKPIPVPLSYYVGIDNATRSWYSIGYSDGAVRTETGQLWILGPIPGKGFGIIEVREPDPTEAARQSLEDAIPTALAWRLLDDPSPITAVEPRPDGGSFVRYRLPGHTRDRAVIIDARGQITGDVYDATADPTDVEPWLYAPPRDGCPPMLSKIPGSTRTELEFARCQSVEGSRGFDVDSVLALAKADPRIHQLFGPPDAAAPEAPAPTGLQPPADATPAPAAGEPDATGVADPLGSPSRSTAGSATPGRAPRQSWVWWLVPGGALVIVAAIFLRIRRGA